MSPEDFIETAMRLLVEPCKEADKRSAISRAYYGALHASRMSLPQEYAPTMEELRSDGSHKAVIQRLSDWGKALAPGRTDAQQAARKLARLKLARRTADYEIHKDVNNDDVATCVADSQKIVDLVRNARSRFDKDTAEKQA